MVYFLKILWLINLFQYFITKESVIEFEWIEQVEKRLIKILETHSLKRSLQISV